MSKRNPIVAHEFRTMGHLGPSIGLLTVLEADPDLARGHVYDIGYTTGDLACGLIRLVSLTRTEVAALKKGSKPMSQKTFLVVCRADRKPDGEPGDYELATRQAFATQEAAAAYSATLSESRQPLVVSGRFFGIRPPASPGMISRPG